MHSQDYTKQTFPNISRESRQPACQPKREMHRETDSATNAWMGQVPQASALLSEYGNLIRATARATAAQRVSQVAVGGAT